jgi:hypothetical protein
MEVKTAAMPGRRRQDEQRAAVTQRRKRKKSLNQSIRVKTLTQFLYAADSTPPDGPPIGRRQWAATRPWVVSTLMLVGHNKPNTLAFTRHLNGLAKWAV